MIRQYGYYYIQTTVDGGPCVDLSALCDALASCHGGGLDTNYHVNVTRNGTVHVRTEFHRMNDNGYYCGWVPVNLYIRRATEDKINHLIGPCAGQTQTLYRRGDIVARLRVAADLDFLGERFDYALSGLGIVWWL